MAGETFHIYNIIYTYEGPVLLEAGVGTLQRNYAGKIHHKPRLTLLKICLTTFFPPESLEKRTFCQSKILRGGFFFK